MNYLLDRLLVLCEYVPGISMKTNNQTYYYITDRLGSVRYVLDESGSIVQSYIYYLKDRSKKFIEKDKKVRIGKRLKRIGHFPTLPDLGDAVWCIKR